MRLSIRYDNKELRIELPLIEIYDSCEYQKHVAGLTYLMSQNLLDYLPVTGQGPYLALLNYQHDSEPMRRPGAFGIYLEKTGESRQEGGSEVLSSYIRIRSHTIESIDMTWNWKSKVSEVYVVDQGDDNLHGFREARWPPPYWIKNISTTDGGFAVVDAYPHGSWYGKGEGIQLYHCNTCGTNRALVFRNNAGDGFWSY